MHDNRYFGVYHKAAKAGMMLLATGAVLHGISRKAVATPATLSFYPTTDIYGKGVLHLDVDYYGSTDFKTTTFTNYGLTYGTGPDRDGVLGRSEVGFDFIASPFQGVALGKRLWFNGKTQLYNNDAAGTRVVAGIWGLGAKGNLGTGETTFPPRVGYLLGSKTFKWGRVHTGVAHAFADEEVLTTPGGNHDRTYLHLAYDKYITPKVQIGADFYSGKSAISVLAPVAYYYLNPNTSFLISYVRYNDSSIKPRNQIYLAFDYSFGGKSSAPAAEATPAPAP